MPAVQRTTSIGAHAEQIALQSGQGEDRPRRRGTPDSRRDERRRIARSRSRTERRCRAPTTAWCGATACRLRCRAESRRSRVELVFSSGVSRMPPTPQIAMKKNAGAGAEHQFGIVAHKARHAIDRAQHGQRPTACLRSGSRPSARGPIGPTRNSKSGQRTFSRPSWLAGDVEGAEPFDVRAGARREHRINQQRQAESLPRTAAVLAADSLRRPPHAASTVKSTSCAAARSSLVCLIFYHIF